MGHDEPVLGLVGMSRMKCVFDLGIIDLMALLPPSMALLIEKWLGVKHGGRAEVWAGMQLDYDMWQARQDHAA